MIDLDGPEPIKGFEKMISCFCASLKVFAVAREETEQIGAEYLGIEYQRWSPTGIIHRQVCALPARDCQLQDRSATEIDV